MITKVGDLIDPASNTWDEDLIEQTMWSIDVQRILLVPLPQHDMQDFIAWNYTKKWYFLGSISLFYGVGPLVWKQIKTL